MLVVAWQDVLAYVTELQKHRDWYNVTHDSDWAKARSLRRAYCHLFAFRGLVRTAPSFFVNILEDAVLPHELHCCSCHASALRSEEHTSELQSPDHLVCR